jgi:spermidine synthase
MSVKKKPSPVLWRKKSRFQKIELIRDRKGILMKLNGWPQVHSHEEVLYHENVSTVPMMLARKVDRCVVLGGGDGLAARNMLRFKGVKSLTLVELDPGVIEMCSRQPDFAALNEGVLTDPRLKVITGDAIAWFLNARGKFDVIINDIETAFTNQPRKLTLDLHFRLFRAMAEKLAPGGVAVVTVPDDFDQNVLKGFFAEYGDMLPPEKRAVFRGTKDVFVRSRVLLGSIFPQSLQWTLRFPILGPHASYYLGHDPMKKFHRFPVPPPRYVKRDFLRTTLR